MFVFLALAMAISYYLLSTLLYHEKKQELLNISVYDVVDIDGEVEEGEGGEDAEDGEHGEHGEHDNKNDEYQEHLDMDVYFYYFVSSSGQLIKAYEIDSGFRQELLKLFVNERPSEVKIVEEELSINNIDDVHLLAIGRPIYDKEDIIGYLYAGLDITPIHDFLNLLKLIMIILLFIFLILAVVIGNFMAGRAMIPIQTSFQRQREFVADASHELRTPLSVMQASLEVVESEENNKLTDFSIQVIEDMKDEVKRMSRMVSELLTLARVDSGATQILKEFFDFQPVLDKLIRSMNHLAEKKNINLTANIPKEIMIYADEERLTQLVYILLDNAVKYTPENGDVLLDISFFSKKGKEMMKINVADNGIGIPENERDEIFKRFYRIDKVRSRDLGGSGLGLSIAKWIVEEHGGIIYVESKWEKGSSFTVQIPIINNI